MVKALHAAGLEVILDVVFNHTAEGGADGPTLCFRGLDEAAYYRLDEHGGYIDDTGCGNTLDADRPTGLRLVMDALRHWREEMHVDGFRFDLAAALGRGDNGFDPHAAFLQAVGQDPVLSRVQAHRRALGHRRATRSATSRSAGASGTAATATPCATSGAARRGRSPTSRPASRGPRTSTATTAGARRRRSTSSPSTTASRSPTSSATTRKHNEANGEDNRDGTDDNRSWNCGVEGPTSDPDVLALRARQSRNLLATLLLSQGVPLLLGGRRARPHAGRQQQRLLPGQRDELARLAGRRAAGRLRRARPARAPRRARCCAAARSATATATTSRGTARTASR